MNWQPPPAGEPHEAIDPELNAAEQAFADALDQHRPVPAPGFRGALGRHLSSEDPGYGSRPPALRGIAAGWIAAGALALLVALLQGSGSL